MSEYTNPVADIPRQPTLERAVVIGSGIGGLAAGAALQEICNEVIIYEKDQIPLEPTTRKGVPQDEQLHNLLTRAQEHLEELMPGFCESLRQQGAGDANVSLETHVYELGIQMPERDLGLRLMSSWRPKIEYAARELLAGADNVSLRGLSRANGLITDSDNTVRGLIIEDEQGSRTLDASLVIDASGTGSKAHKWFKELDTEEPQVNELQVGQWYVSMLLDRPTDYTDDKSFWLTFPNPPNTRGGLISPLGNDQWYISLSGRRLDSPPRTYEEMIEYASSLEEPTIAELIKSSSPCSAPNLFRKTKASWRRYDLLSNPPSGFMPLGDSIASLNPLFGQGMSVAAWQAAELKEVIGTVQGEDDIREATMLYLSRAALACSAAWSLGDMVNGISPNEKLDGRYWDSLAEAVKHDSDLHRKYVGVWHLIEPVSTLYSPDFLQKVANY